MPRTSWICADRSSRLSMRVLLAFLPIVTPTCFSRAEIGSTSEDAIPVESPARDLDYDDILAPVFVGRPPSDAYIGLSRLENGEVRHYDYGEQSQLVVEEIRDHMRPARAYIFSRDNGLTWFRKTVPPGFIGADRRSPISGEYMRLIIDRDTIYAIRSEGGIDGTWKRIFVAKDKYHMFAPPVFIQGGRRVLVSCHKLWPVHSYGVFYSDDDGFTWKFSEVEPVPNHQPGGVHKGPRWQNTGIEPTVVELKSGRLWMLIRTSQDNHYQSFSDDGGETWTTPEPSRFYGTITMPRMNRLSDGRLLFIWNNATPLPELPLDHPVKANLPEQNKNGVWEDVFTNRGVIHAAISEDDGKTWFGFRELYLDPRRNAPDYAHSGGVDHSVHQSQMVEVDGGKVLVSLGQHPLHRALILFDPAWLYEKTRRSDFSSGLADWSTHSFVAKILGHCSFNRKPGARLVPDPDGSGDMVLRVARPNDPSLLTENQGAVWNFPAGTSGSLTTRIRLPKGSQGARISLIDRWFNPTDTTAHQFAMFTLQLEPNLKNPAGFAPEPDTWHTLRFDWSHTESATNGRCIITVDGKRAPIPLNLNRKSINGISYIHFISTAETDDENGILVESVEAAVK